MTDAYQTRARELGCSGAYRPLNEIDKQCSTGVYGSVDLVRVSDVLLGTVHSL